jgi:hypothetical protein
MLHGRIVYVRTKGSPQEDANPWCICCIYTIIVDKSNQPLAYYFQKSEMVEETLFVDHPLKSAIFSLKEK